MFLRLSLWAPPGYYVFLFQLKYIKVRRDVTYTVIMVHCPAANAPVFPARLVGLTTLSTAKVALRHHTVKVKP